MRDGPFSLSCRAKAAHVLTGHLHDPPLGFYRSRSGRRAPPQARRWQPTIRLRHKRWLHNAAKKSTASSTRGLGSSFSSLKARQPFPRRLPLLSNGGSSGGRFFRVLWARKGSSCPPSLATGWRGRESALKGGNSIGHPGIVLISASGSPRKTSDPTNSPDLPWFPGAAMRRAWKSRWCTGVGA